MGEGLSVATPKRPTVASISALLRKAQFTKSERLPPGLGYSTGYRVTGTPGSGTVTIRHECPPGEDPGPHLAKYAEVVAAAGYAADSGPGIVVVTSRTAKAAGFEHGDRSLPGM